MLHWLHSLLPHIPHYGDVLVFIVAFLNNIGFPLAGETILLGASFMLGKTADSLWQPVAAGTAAGPGSPGKNPLAPSHARKVEVAGAFFQPSRREGGFHRAVHRLVSARRGQPAGHMARMPWRTFLFYNLNGLAACATTYILIGYFSGRNGNGLWRGWVPRRFT